MWRIFQRPINLQPDKVDNIIMACCALQNYLLDNNAMTFTVDADAYVENATWRQEVQTELHPLQRRLAGNHAGREPKDIQETLCRWFNGVGRVDWQDRMVAIGQGLQQHLTG